MAILYLVRHGETDWNRDGRIQGHQDPPLNDAGRAQARALAQRLAEDTVDVAYSSDLQRALETARILLDGRPVPLTAHPDLRERSLGRWEGRRVDEIIQSEPAAWQAWLTRPYHDAPHGGESEAQLERRTAGRLTTIVQAHRDHRILVVSHGGAIRAMLRAILGIELHHIPNCGAYRIHFAGTQPTRYEVLEG